MHRRVVGAGLVVTLVAAGLAAAAAPAAASSASHLRLVLAPNHHISAKGGGGSKSGSGISWPGWASSNWSGYAITKGGYNAATGHWTVPSIAPKPNTFSAAWVGIGGFSTADLIQTGTEQDFYNGSAHYAAWWTTSDLGYAEQVIPGITVNAGDKITASVTNNNDGTWTLSLTDGSQPTFTHQVTFTSSGTSAEWIMEAPGLGRNRQATIADYGTDVFDPSTVNGKDPSFGLADGGILVQKSAVVSIPSTPDTGRPNPADGFAISYGSQQPAAPKT